MLRRARGFPVRSLSSIFINFSFSVAALKREITAETQPIHVMKIGSRCLWLYHENQICSAIQLILPWQLHTFRKHQQTKKMMYQFQNLESTLAALTNQCTNDIIRLIFQLYNLIFHSKDFGDEPLLFSNEKIVSIRRKVASS